MMFSFTSVTNMLFIVVRTRINNFIKRNIIDKTIICIFFNWCYWKNVGILAFLTWNISTQKVNKFKK